MDIRRPGLARRAWERDAYSWPACRGDWRCAARGGGV